MEADDTHITRHPQRILPPAHVHLLGICGSGMAALAGMFHESRYRVTGSDHGIYPPMSDVLAGMGIPVAEGYHPRNLEPRPDLAVVGNVIRRQNPEAVELERSGIPFLSMPEALKEYFIHDKTRIVVAGTHGKSTVSAIIAWVLIKEGFDPGFMIGGLVRNVGKSYRLGRGPFFVVEGDEYDTAYFDKRPKFLHYQPDIAVITSCEFDHGDIYRDVEQIERQFRALTALVPDPGGFIVACADDPRVRGIVNGSQQRTRNYGLAPDAVWSIRDPAEGPDGIRATVVRERREVCRGVFPLLGMHNVVNALAAIAALDTVGVHPRLTLEALASFEGVKRRQEVIGECGDVLVIDDFAHHPTAVRVTCAAVKARYPERRLVAVFEPRTNTSRRAVFQREYVTAFLDADVILVREPRDVEAIPEQDRFSSYRLAKDLRSLGKTAEAFPDTGSILDFLGKALQPTDVALILSNGSFDDLGARLATLLGSGCR